MFVLRGTSMLWLLADEAAWRHKPFAAEVDDGILYGRGAVDMKGRGRGVAGGRTALRWRGEAS